MGEVAALRAVGYVSVLGFAPQVSAIPPFAIFHGMRWLFVYNTSWLTFAGEAVGLVVFQGLLATTIIALAWPEDRNRERPRLRSLLLANLAFVAVVLIILSPWACVAFALSGTSLSWFILGEVLEFVVLALVLQRGGIVPRWWLGLPPPRAAGLTLATFAVLTIASLVINLTPGWWVVPVAGVAGAANAFLWRALIAAVLPGPERVSRLARSTLARRLRLPAVMSAVGRWFRVPGLAVVTALALTGGGLLIMGHIFTGSGHSRTGTASPLRSSLSRHRAAVLFVDGYDSSYNGTDPVVDSPGLVYKVYSYRGLGRGNLPRPYSAIDTHQSLARSAQLLATQIRVLHKATGLPVGILAESEGTLVTRTYLDETRHPPVDAVAMFSPLIRPSRVYYPLPEAGSGFGYVTGLELRGMFALLRDSGSPPVSIHEPFVRSMIRNAPLYRNHMLCPTPGIRSIAFLSLAAATVAPPGPLSDIPVVEMPGVHASLIHNPRARAEAIRFFQGGPVRQHTMTAFDLLRDASAAWVAPALPLSVNPVWHYPPGAPDAAFGGPICRPPR
jgi:hypothetical protein